MLYVIVALFAVGAVMGLILANAIISGKPSTPKGVVVAHGLFVASGLVALIVYMINNPDNYPKVSLILFVIAALGGFYLLYNDLGKKKPGPTGVVILHALLAVSAFVLLLLFTFF